MQIITDDIIIRFIGCISLCVICFFFTSVFLLKNDFFSKTVSANRILFYADRALSNNILKTVALNSLIPI